MKLAILIAPFLLVGGYIASDYYVTLNTGENKIYPLAKLAPCNLFAEGCVFSSGNMQIRINTSNDTTNANTSFPVESVVIALVFTNKKETIYRLDKQNNRQYWSRKTEIQHAVSKGLAATLRVLIKDENAIYLKEVLVKPNGDIN